MSFVRTSYTVNPNYAKSVSSLYTFSFNVYNPVSGNMNLKIRFPNNFLLTTATDCQIKINTNLITGVGCAFDPTTNQVSLIL